MSRSSAPSLYDDNPDDPVAHAVATFMINSSAGRKPGANLTSAVMSAAQDKLGVALARILYAGFLGVRGDIRGDELTLILPFSQHLIGNPLLPALHGGVVGAFMELTAITQLAISSGRGKIAQDHRHQCRLSALRQTHRHVARARVVKIGRRIANVQVEAWQAERGQPIASLHGHFLIAESESTTT